MELKSLTTKSKGNTVHFDFILDEFPNGEDIVYVLLFFSRYWRGMYTVKGLSPVVADYPKNLIYKTRKRTAGICSIYIRFYMRSKSDLFLRIRSLSPYFTVIELPETNEVILGLFRIENM